jgi:uncharacterized protein (DUF433 family)
MKSALFWDIMQHIVVIPYQCFGTPISSIFTGEEIQVKNTNKNILGFF